MKLRFSFLATGLLVVAAVALMSERGWAIYYELDPSKDEWKMKYDVEVSAAEGDKLTVVFTVADEGRLKPFSKIEVIALSKQKDARGGQTYELQAPIKLKATKDGKLAGQAQISKDIADRAKIRIVTLTVDGKRRPSNAGAYYMIPIAKYLKNSSTVSAPASPTPPSAKAPAANVTK